MSKTIKHGSSSKQWTWYDYYLFLLLFFGPVIATFAILIRESSKVSAFAFIKGVAIISLAANLIIEFVSFLIVFANRKRSNNPKPVVFSKTRLAGNSINAFLISFVTFGCVFALISTIAFDQTRFNHDPTGTALAYTYVISAFFIIAAFIGFLSVSIVFLMTGDYWTGGKENYKKALFFGVFIILCVGSFLLIHLVANTADLNEFAIIDRVNTYNSAVDLISAVIFAAVILVIMAFLIFAGAVTLFDTNNEQVVERLADLVAKVVILIYNVCDGVISTIKSFTNVLQLPPKIIDLYLGHDDMNDFTINYHKHEKTDQNKKNKPERK